jgi:hypothetical protein
VVALWAASMRYCLPLVRTPNDDALQVEPRRRHHGANRIPMQTLYRRARAA